MGFFYLGLAFIGAVVPYSFLGQFILTHGTNVAEFKVQLWANSISSFCGLSFFIAGFVTLVFIFKEGRRLKMKGLWLPFFATLLVGASCGLPLFLYLRSLKLSMGSDGKAEAGDDIPALPAPKR